MGYSEFILRDVFHAKCQHLARGLYLLILFNIPLCCCRSFASISECSLLGRSLGQEVAAQGENAGE